METRHAFCALLVLLLCLLLPQQRVAAQTSACLTFPHYCTNMGMRCVVNGTGNTLSDLYCTSSSGFSYPPVLGNCKTSTPNFPVTYDAGGGAFGCEKACGSGGVCMHGATCNNATCRCTWPFAGPFCEVIDYTHDPRGFFNDTSCELAGGSGTFGHIADVSVSCYSSPDPVDQMCVIPTYGCTSCDPGAGHGWSCSQKTTESAIAESILNWFVDTPNLAPKVGNFPGDVCTTFPGYFGCGNGGSSLVSINLDVNSAPGNLSYISRSSIGIHDTSPFRWSSAPNLVQVALSHPNFGIGFAYVFGSGTFNTATLPNLVNITIKGGGFSGTVDTSFGNPINNLTNINLQGPFDTVLFDGGSSLKTFNYSYVYPNLVYSGVPSTLPTVKMVSSIKSPLSEFILSGQPLTNLSIQNPLGEAFPYTIVDFFDGTVPSVTLLSFQWFFFGTSPNIPLDLLVEEFPGLSSLSIVECGLVSPVPVISSRPNNNLTSINFSGNNFTGFIPAGYGSPALFPNLTSLYFFSPEGGNVLSCSISANYSWVKNSDYPTFIEECSGCQNGTGLCQSNSTCYIVNSTQLAACDCGNLTFRGEYCQNPFGSCNGSVCPANGYCVENTAHMDQPYSCSCNPNWYGPNCDIPMNFTYSFTVISEYYNTGATVSMFVFEMVTNYPLYFPAFENYDGSTIIPLDMVVSGDNSTITSKIAYTCFGACVGYYETYENDAEITMYASGSQDTILPGTSVILNQYFLQYTAEQFLNPANSTTSLFGVPQPFHTVLQDLGGSVNLTGFLNLTSVGFFNCSFVVILDASEAAVLVSNTSIVNNYPMESIFYPNRTEIAEALGVTYTSPFNFTYYVACRYAAPQHSKKRGILTDGGGTGLVVAGVGQFPNITGMVLSTTTTTMMTTTTALPTTTTTTTTTTPMQASSTTATTTALPSTTTTTTPEQTSTSTPSASATSTQPPTTAPTVPPTGPASPFGSVSVAGFVGALVGSLLAIIGIIGGVIFCLRARRGMPGNHYFEMFESRQT